MATPKQRVIALIDNADHPDKTELESLFDSLQPASLESLMGEWSGGSLETGHPSDPWLKEIRWVGKVFKSVDDIYPIIALDDDGKKVWLEKWGGAQLLEGRYRGVVYAAMVYDNYPIDDYFRHVSDDVIMGMMDAKQWRDAGPSFFFLERLDIDHALYIAFAGPNCGR